MSLSFYSQDDIRRSLGSVNISVSVNRSSQVFRDISPLSNRLSKFLKEHCKEDESSKGEPWFKTNESLYNKSFSDSCGLVNTSVMGSIEVSKHSKETGLLKNQFLLIRNSLKLLKSQVDIFMKINTETLRMEEQGQETIRNELKSLLDWLEPKIPEHRVQKQDPILRESLMIMGEENKSYKTSYNITDLKQDVIKLSDSMQEEPSLTINHFNEVNNLQAFMQKMENELDHLTDQLKVLEERIEAFEQLNWPELLNNLRIKVQEQTVKLCMSYIVRELDKDIFEA
uniref:Uncharacterized protein n=1 Tax=Trichobilharzia regenti TaxID=157069 RepID=A0AA85IV11_TRIRE|nr:unnamed protein product [Trichobilharzia regenti]